jgi:hypothetical protein
MDLNAVKIALQGPVADRILEAWRLKAADHVSTGSYMGYLTRDQAVVYPNNGNELSLGIVNHAPHAKVLEDGHPGFHLPDAIHWPTPKSKVAKDGHYYLTIPFRHYTPGDESGGSTTHRERATMPAAVYRAAKMLGTGEDAKAKARLARFDFRVTRHYGLMAQQFQTFPRIGSSGAISEFQRMRMEGRGYTWKAGKFAGMVRKTQQMGNGGLSSTYTTFRTLKDNSPGWYVPPFGGYHLAAETLREVAPEVRRIVAEAAKEDVLAELQVTFGSALE